MKEISDTDLLFVETMFELGSVKRAAEHLDVTTKLGHKIVARNREYILEMTQIELAGLAGKAVMTVSDSMDDDGTTSKGELRLKGAESVLDRIGASKRQVTEHEVKQESPVILMPAKDIVITPTIKVSSDEEA